MTLEVFIRDRISSEVARLKKLVEDSGNIPDMTAIYCQALADLEHDVAIIVSDFERELRSQGYDIPWR